MKCGTYTLSSIAVLFGDLENASVTSLLFCDDVHERI